LILKYIIEYSSNDDNYALLIKELVDKGKYNVCIVRAQGAIILYIDEGEDEIKAFFTMLGQKLPLSVYVGQSRIEEVGQFPQFPSELRKTALWSTCYPDVLSSILDENNKEYLNPFIFSDSRAKSININSKEYKTNSSEITDDLKIIAQKLASGETVSFENEHGKFGLTTKEQNNSLCQTIFCINLNKIAVQWKIPNTALFALSSMERPFVTIATNDSEDKGFFLRLTIPSDPLQLSIAKLLNDTGIDRVFIVDNKNTTFNIKYKGIALPEPAPEILIQKNKKLFLSNEVFNKDILPIFEDCFVAYFGEDFDSSFIALRPNIHSKELLNVKSFETNITKEIETVDKNGLKLVANFKKKFASLLEKAENTGGKYDFEKFIRASAAILGFNGENGYLAYLVNLANKNKAPVGVKIDFILENENNQPTLNLVKSFRTLLSYKLAGVEDSTLAFSIFESFADFVTILIDEARKGFDAKEIVLCGGAFYSETLSDRVFAKARNIRVSSAYLPQIFG